MEAWNPSLGVKICTCSLFIYLLCPFHCGWNPCFGCFWKGDYRRCCTCFNGSDPCPSHMPLLTFKCILDLLSRAGNSPLILANVLYLFVLRSSLVLICRWYKNTFFWNKNLLEWCSMYPFIVHVLKTNQTTTHSIHLNELVFTSVASYMHSTMYFLILTPPRQQWCY